MATYLLAYNGGSQPASEEEGQAVMASWIAWFEAIGSAVVDAGNPFGPSATVGVDGRVAPGGASGLTGYSVVQADDLGAATRLAQGCPQLAAGGTVEVYETFDVM